MLACIACFALAGCRAVLGLEDPPAETGAGGAPATTSASSSTVSPVGSGGAGPLASSGDDAASSVASSGSEVTIGAGGATAGTGGGEGGSGPRDVYDLGAQGLRLAWDARQELLIAVDVLGNFWALSEDLSSIQRCSAEGFDHHPDDASYMAATDRHVAYSANGTSTRFLQIEPTWTVGSMETCDGPVMDFDVSGMTVRNLQFWGMGTQNAEVAKFDYGVYTLYGELPPTEFYKDGGVLDLAQNSAFGGTVGPGGEGRILRYDLAGGIVYSTSAITEPDGRFIAVTGAPGESFYAWAREDDGDTIYFANGAFLDPPEYEGIPALAADDSHLYFTTMTGVAICNSSRDCITVHGNDERAVDVKVVGETLYVLQGSRVFRYDTGTLQPPEDAAPLL